MSTSFAVGFLDNVYNNTSEVNKSYNKGYDVKKISGIKEFVIQIYGEGNYFYDYFLPTDTKVKSI